ncbi:MAG TPA: DUF4330 domain-containing protein [Dictyoglomaceae bacterium]|nr:DUF4330 domain-containing protein [Dictyoglomaceae bacterium]HOL39038.1 DUF4330 domain-containing protein [Dictyoglomaceae bacterium]HOP94377.1 DUF4330 domain-containing protein [Dictyoglomaceae bacterium]HPP15786.1 DUF4330 domain-containing protein [Dictyoglomaceae bacterium]HPU42775.1 DUF4330 domain-containing protein [Dictyoglomaceae bacterium]
MKKINIFDLFVVIVILLAIGGFFLVREGKTPLANVQGEEKEVEVDIIVRNLPLNDHDVLKPGEKAFIRIKNQPFAWVTIKDVKIYKKKSIIPNFNGTYITVDDINNPFNVDMLITFTSKGYVTEDSVVLGVKIKVGMGINIESFKMDTNGVVSAIKY